MLQSFQKIKTLFNKKKVEKYTTNTNETTKDVYYYSIDKNDFIQAKIPNHMNIIDTCYNHEDFKESNESHNEDCFKDGFSGIYNYDNYSATEYDTEYTTEYATKYDLEYDLDYSQNLNLYKENDNVSIWSISEYIEKYYYYDKNTDMFYTRNFEGSSIYSVI